MKQSYYKNPIINNNLVNDISQLNLVEVQQTKAPESIEELSNIISQSNLPISIGGGRFSMGGQTAQKKTLFIDMRNLNKIQNFDPINKTISVETGITWAELQNFIDPYNLSIKIMQTYANFTVGGSLSVNCHGRYVGFGPLILSVLEIEVLTANGFLKASPKINSDLFYGSIGCYGALGIITSVKLQLDDNYCIKRTNNFIDLNEYHKFFQTNIKSNPNAVLHNGLIQGKDFNTVNSVTWVKTNKIAKNSKLKKVQQNYSLQRGLVWLLSETNIGPQLRKNVLERLYYSTNKISWKNNEAGYNIAELEPKSRKNSTYLLQEYFIPVNNFNSFIIKMKDILNKYDVNVLNISIRHSHKDSGSYLAWAREEVYAFVIYYKQGTSIDDQKSVAIWTQELINASLQENGTYYLPYQVFATKDQFKQAYPRFNELFALKDRYDPEYRFQNILWEKYRD